MGDSMEALTQCAGSRPGRSRGPLAALLCSLLAAGLPAAARAQEPPGPPAAEEAPTVARVELVATDAGRVDWAPRGDWIAYERIGDDGYSQLWVARPDGTGGRCLTCGPLEFRRHHAGNPAWHPSGRYLVFQLEKPLKRSGTPVPFMAVPGRNLGDDLWAVAFDGRSYWRLTSLAERGSGRALSPRFSHEGDRLVWSERVASGGGRWGEWVLRVAKIEEKRGGPRLRGAETHRVGSGRGFCEPYGFTTDDRSVILASDAFASEGGGTDLYVLALDGGEVRAWTSEAEQWDRFARLAPNGRKLVWASSRGGAGRPPAISRETTSAAVTLDLWMMSPGGLDVERLTHFSDVFSPDFSGRMMVTSAAWSREGDRLLVSVAPVDRPLESSLFRIDLSRPYGR